MTRITIAYAWRREPVKGTRNDWTVVKYAWKEDDGTDKVRLVNQANKQVLDALEACSSLVESGDVIKGPPPEHMYSLRLFDAYLEFYTSGDRGKPHVSVDYLAYPHCPLEIISEGMKVVGMFRKELKPILVR